jgi:hypothetical protein
MTTKAVAVAERGLRVAAEAFSTPWSRPFTPVRE